MRRKLSITTLGVLFLGVFVFAGLGLSAPDPRYAHFEKSGIRGSRDDTTMQSIWTPARIARVVSVPGRGGREAWGLGTSIAGLQGWSHNPAGQVVFLKYTTEGGWRLIGPPVGSDGRAVQLQLSDVDVSSTGEGWAVGENGSLLHKPPDTDQWRVHPDSGQTGELLQSVSLVESGGITFGYAVGKNASIMRYDGTSWDLESPTAEMVADSLPGFIGVTTISHDRAWIVSDETSTGLKVYQRQNSGWSRFQLGDPVFEGPFPAVTRNGGLNRSARGSAIGAAGSTVWVGGVIRPSDVGDFISEDEAADATRPFLIRIRGSSRTSFCPDRYRLRNDESGRSIPDTGAICDQPFPTASFDIPSISALSDGEAYAGGLGLFHYKDGGWFREPNSNGYLIDVSMATPTEGWVATTGQTYFRGNAIRANSPLVGRWSASPHRSSIARWPQNQKRVLEAIAIHPDGVRAIAAGDAGAVIQYSAKLGWDQNLPALLENLHGASWPGDTAWIVGDKGLIGSVVGRKWTIHPRVTTNALYSVAFRSPSDGVAVGSGGVILRYNGSSWSLDPQSGKVTKNILYKVIATSSGYAASGQDGTVIEFVGGAWTAHPEIGEFLARPTYPDPPDLYSLTALPSGALVAGGQRSALVRNDGPGSRFVLFDPPLDGTVLALAAASRNLDGVERIWASVSPDERKFDGTSPGATRGTVVLFEGSTWTDVSRNRRLPISFASDSSSFDDPVYDLATLDGVRGWAAGGTPAGVQDSEFHLRTKETGSIYRMDLHSDPKRSFTQADLKFPDAVNFAVFGETWCGKGLCTASIGSGTMADAVALQIRDEINRAAALPRGPKFVLFTGNMRMTGIPEELAQFKKYLDGFDIPVYGAPGSRDLFVGLDPMNLVNLPDVPTGSGSNLPWKRMFSEMTLPWGTKVSNQPPSYIRMLPGTGVLDTNLARTHFAFDVVQGQTAQLRVVVLDSSTRSYGDPSTQNPRENQGTWFDNLVTSSKLAGVPVVVAMNQPTIFPGNAQLANWTLDKPRFESTAALGVTAVFSGGLRMNGKDSIPSRGGIVPVYLVGGGGAPLGYDPTVGQPPPTKIPHDGYYHAWHLVSVNPDPAAANLLGQAPHEIHTFPILETLAMHSIKGETVKVGNTMQFTAMARQLLGGWSDPDQANATYLEWSDPSFAPCPFFGQGGGRCRSKNAIAPPFRFYSEDRSIADFVLPDFGKGGDVPRLHDANGNILLDHAGTYGLLCTFKPGTIGINVQSGWHRARMVITVTHGFGPCIGHPVEPPLVEPEIPPVPPVVEEVPPAPFFYRPPLSEPLALALPPAPGPIAAPAPPASAAGARKEEEEAQYEQQKDEGDNAEARALHFYAYQDDYTTVRAWLHVGAVCMAAVVLALATASIRHAHRREKYVEIRI